MRKSRWIALCIASFIAAVFLILEQRRGVFFLQAEPPAVFHSWDRALALAMQKAEWTSLDQRFRLRGARIPHPDIAIIAIDEKSLGALHQWPWPRGIHAQLIQTLAAAPPKALLFDVLFIDPFTASPSGDQALVEATRKHPWVVHALFFEMQGDRIAGAKLPFRALVEDAANLGYVNAFADADGLLRTAQLERPVGEQKVVLLSLAGASLYLNKTPDDILQSIPTLPGSRLSVNYAGPEYTFPYFSYADVLSGKIPPSRFAGKVVMVGATATGTFDHYPTPLSAFMPGIEFHANVIDNLLQGNALRYAGLRPTYVVIVLFALICGLLLARLSAWKSALWTGILATAYAGSAQWMFAHKNLILDVAGPTLTLVCGYVAILVYRFFTEEREKRWVKAAFGQYVSPKVLDVLMEDPSKLSLVGERREISVLFSDVAGFTSISERLNPDELVVLLNRYLTAMTEVVFAHDGYLNKYMGDGIMAFWNAPVKQADHAERACRCALKSVERLDALNKELQAQGIAPLQARIGINTGTMVVGNMGSAQKSDYTVMGDHVNLGSRLEGANKAFGTAIMISEFTYKVVQDLFEVRFLDILRVPGKARAVRTYQLLGEKGSLSSVWSQALPIYHEAVHAFGARDFSGARDKFKEALSLLGHDKACETYIQRAELFIQNPPPEDWDGVFEVKTK